MPVGYTEMYARKLDELSRAARWSKRGKARRVRRASCYLAPAGRHLTFAPRPAAGASAHLDVRPLDTPHRPSVDVLFQSAAEVYGERVLGVVMTGMGADGREGRGVDQGARGRILTEAEETCVVYGMPRSVVEAGLSDASVPLDAHGATP